MITKAKPVDEEPHVTLTDWIIIRAHDTGDMHFVGCTPEDKGRVTTAIQDFDPNTMSGRTASGRFYKLDGEQADNHFAAVVTIAAIWGPHMVGRISVVDRDDTMILLPARGMA
ncbi:hypothetical protein [Mesorhizobium sp. A623]